MRWLLLSLLSDGSKLVDGHNGNVILLLLFELLADSVELSYKQIYQLSDSGYLPLWSFSSSRL